LLQTTMGRPTASTLHMSGGGDGSRCPHGVDCFYNYQPSGSFQSGQFTSASITFTFSHLADAFIQSDLQGIHILHFTFTLMAHCTSGAIRGAVPCSRTLRQGIKLATFCVIIVLEWNWLSSASVNCTGQRRSIDLCVYWSEEE